MGIPDGVVCGTEDSDKWDMLKIRGMPRDACNSQEEQVSVGWFTYMEKEEPDLMGRLPPRWNDRGV